MRVAGVREIRNNLAALFGGHEPVLVTKHGKLSGLYLPLDDCDHLPTDLRREIAAVLGRHLDAMLKASEVSEETVLEDFNACRRRGRGC
jgi:PHD/YefM family antitoxin component YafN of YafNO toxin-antitoxin module